MFCSVIPITNLALSAFSIWKHFVTFNELEHWMEESLGFSYTCCWACNTTQIKIKVCRSEVEGLPQVLPGRSQWPMEEDMWLLMFPAWK